MNSLEVKSKPQNLSQISASYFNGNPDTPRLIILLPEKDVNDIAVVHRIWELANVHGANIQFLCLCSEPDHEASIRRKLVMISALTQDTMLKIETKIEFGNDWVKAVKSNWKNGDMLVCFKEHRAGWRHGPLSKILETTFPGPIYLLSGMMVDEYDRANWKSQLVAWTGFIAILIGFFLLDINIQPQADWVHQTLFFVSIIVEVGMLWLWNAIF